jgi:phage replication-related protein YjqB (UPF0714/DUF867 family)
VKKLGVVLVSSLLVLTMGSTAFAAVVGYKNYADLAKNQKLGTDYNICVTNIKSDTSILATHGGKIQTDTSEIASAIAKAGCYNLYTFDGIKSKGNSILFLKNTIFDEPQALSMVQSSKNVISIIGCSDSNNTIYIGGQNDLLISYIDLSTAFNLAGSNVPYVEETPDAVNGLSNNNIVNKGINPLSSTVYSTISDGGVQLAISKDYRDSLVNDPKELNTFSGDVNAAVTEYNKFIAKVSSTHKTFNILSVAGQNSSTIDFNTVYNKIKNGDFNSLAALTNYFEKTV